MWAQRIMIGEFGSNKFTIFLYLYIEKAYMIDEGACIILFINK